VASYGVDLSGSAWVSVADCCEHRNECSGCIKDWEFRDQMSYS
jgi:hypothetical protein